MKKSKFEWSTILICEFVFAIIGILFTVLAIIFGLFIDEIAKSPNSHGNVYIIPWVFGGVGILFLVVFVILLSISIKQKNGRNQLIEQGRYINARVIEVKENLYVKINHRHPYYVICEGENPYTGEKYTFRSDNIMDDPFPLLNQYLRVYFDYSNPKNYYVDLDYRR